MTEAAERERAQVKSKSPRITIKKKMTEERKSRDLKRKPKLKRLAAPSRRRCSRAIQKNSKLRSSLKHHKTIICI